MKGGMGRGAAWMVLLKAVDRLLGIVSTLILARLLAPADFGLVAMAMSVIAVIELAGAFSFESALIQKQNPGREHYDTVWTLNVALSGSCALAMAALAVPVAHFYSEPRLVLVMLVLSSAWFVQAFENVGTVDFRRDMQFDKDFRLLLTKRLIAFVVTTVLALALRSYWALIAGMVAGRLAGVALSYGMNEYRPRFCLAARRELFSFSAWLFLNNVLSVSTARLSHFVIGRLYGPEPLGVFTVGAEIAALPSSDLVAPIGRAVFPGFSRLVHRAEGLQEGFVQVLGVIALLAVPACVGLALVAEPLVEVALGRKWSAAVPIIQVLAVSGVLGVLTSNNYSAYLALGKTRIPPILGAIHLSALIALLYALSGTGVVGIAFAQMGAMLVSTAPSFYLIVKVLGLHPRTLLGAIWRPLVAAAAMASGFWAAPQLIGSGPGQMSAAINLLVQVLYGAVVYVFATLALWFAAGRPSGAESIYCDYLRRSLAVLQRRY